jgi:hypothetical protein
MLQDLSIRLFWRGSCHSIDTKLQKYGTKLLMGESRSFEKELIISSLIQFFQIIELWAITDI